MVVVVVVVVVHKEASVSSRGRVRVEESLL